MNEDIYQEEKKQNYLSWKKTHFGTLKIIINYVLRNYNLRSASYLIVTLHLDVLEY